jgi:hypothetical protein
MDVGRLAGCDPQAIHSGTIFLNEDGSVDVDWSDRDWGRLHRLRNAPVEINDAAWHARVDAQLKPVDSKSSGG